MALTQVPTAALEELQRVYAQLSGELEPYRRHCSARGHCCNFARSGHRLYLTDLEAAEMARCGLEPETDKSENGICPYLRDGKCGAREYRGLGCRMYYCDGTYESERNDLYERTLKDIRAIEARHGIAHQYRMVTAIDFKEFAS